MVLSTTVMHDQVYFDLIIDYPSNDIISIIAVDRQDLAEIDLTGVFLHHFPGQLDEIFDKINWDEIYEYQKQQFNEAI